MLVWVSSHKCAHSTIKHPRHFPFSLGYVGDQSPRKNSGSHIDASHSRQPLVKGERLVRYEVNAVMHDMAAPTHYPESLWTLG